MNRLERGSSEQTRSAHPGGSRPTYDTDVARYRDRNGRFVKR
jgi:hypothetical protein